MTKYTAEEIAESAEYLHYRLGEGQIVYTNLRHVAQSGMSRAISVHVIYNGEIVDLTHHVARFLDYSTENVGRGRGLNVWGAGMDMGFHIVYSLAHKLYGDGYALNHRWL